MALIKISLSCKSLCLHITADVSKISKSVQGDIAYILNVLPEIFIAFARICLVPEIKHVISFIKTRFY